MTSITEQIGELIGKDELPKVVRILKDLLKNSPKLDEVLIHSGRLNDLMKQVRTGRVNFHDANVAKNQIRYAILDLLRMIDDTAQDNNDVKKELSEYLNTFFQTGNTIILNRNRICAKMI